jgi:hypothetical protein
MTDTVHPSLRRRRHANWRVREIAGGFADEVAEAFVDADWLRVLTDHPGFYDLVGQALGEDDPVGLLVAENLDDFEEDKPLRLAASECAIGWRRALKVCDD